MFFRYDPSNTGSPLDAYKFYNHPSVSGLSKQASLASYSPEAAFLNFGAQFPALQDGYPPAGGPPSLARPAVAGPVVIKSSHVPLSIASAEHPLHDQVFRFNPQSFVQPYPLAAQSNFRALDASPSPSPTSSSTSTSTTDTAADAASTEAADVTTAKSDAATEA